MALFLSPNARRIYDRISDAQNCLITAAHLASDAIPLADARNSADAGRADSKWADADLAVDDAIRSLIMAKAELHLGRHEARRKE